MKIKNYLAVPVVTYLLGAFANASFNLEEWNPDGRGITACIAGFILAAMVLNNYMEGCSK